MLELSALATQLVVQSPMMLVLLAGLVLVVVRRRNRPGRPFSLAVAGIGMLLIGTLMTSAWQIAVPWIITDRHLSASQFGPISIGVGALLGVWHAGGIGLLLGAAVSRGRTATAAPTPPAPAPASAPPAGFAPGGVATFGAGPGGAPAGGVGSGGIPPAAGHGPGAR